MSGLSLIAGRAINCFAAGDAAAGVLPTANLPAIYDLRLTEGLCDRTYVDAPMPPLAKDAYFDMGITAKPERRLEKHTDQFMAIDRVLLAGVKAFVTTAPDEPTRRRILQQAVARFDRQAVHALGENAPFAALAEQASLEDKWLNLKGRFETGNIVPLELWARRERGKQTIMGAVRIPFELSGFVVQVALGLPEQLPLPADANVLGLQRAMYASIASGYSLPAQAAAWVQLRAAHHPLMTSEARAAERAFMGAFGMVRR